LTDGAAEAMLDIDEDGVAPMLLLLRVRIRCGEVGVRRGLRGKGDVERSLKDWVGVGFAGDGNTFEMEGRIFCLELEVGMVKRSAIGLVEGVVGLVGGTAYERFFSASTCSRSDLCLAFDAAVGALNPLERAEMVEEVNGVPDDDETAADPGANDDRLALRGSRCPPNSADGPGESCSRPTDFWCFKGAVRGEIEEGAEGEPGMVKRLIVEAEAWDEELERSEDGRSDEKVGETRDDRESFLVNER